MPMKDHRTVDAGEPASARTRSGIIPTHRILLVDDDSDIRRLNAEALKRSGYEVDTAEDGAAGWETLSACSYDLLITDNNMPKLSGVDLLKRLRAARMELPVIMATGALPTEEFTRYPWLQPAATLLKPIDHAQHFLARSVVEVQLRADLAAEPAVPEQTREGRLDSWRSRECGHWARHIGEARGAEGRVHRRHARRGRKPSTLSHCHALWPR